MTKQEFRNYLSPHIIQNVFLSPLKSYVCDISFLFISARFKFLITFSLFKASNYFLAILLSISPWCSVGLAILPARSGSLIDINLASLIIDAFFHGRFHFRILKVFVLVFSYLSLHPPLSTRQTVRQKLSSASLFVLLPSLSLFPTHQSPGF